jgi:hypothetical protein
MSDDRSPAPARPRVTEVVEGELDVRCGPVRSRVLLPAGVGVPGLDDAEVAGWLVVALLDRDGTVPAVVDASQALARDPSLLTAVERSAETADVVRDDPA